MSSAASPPSTPTLQRVVSTPMLALYGIGNIVGAGVYVLIGKIAEPAGYLSVLAFLVAALVAFSAALSYAELATRYPVSGGISIYLHEAFHKVRLSTVMGLLLIGAGMISTATLLKGFSGYFHALVPIHPAIIIIVMLLILLGITLRGIKESVGAAAILTIIEVCGLLFLIGSILIAQPDALQTYGSNFTDALGSIDGAAMAGVLSASFIAFYAFIGFEDMVNVAEEVKDPKRAFPRAILAALALVSILYVAVAVVTLGILTPTELGSGDAPLAEAYTAATGNTAGVIVVISLMAILNGIIVNLVMGSRFLYGLANKNWITPWFSKVSSTHVPTRGLLLMATVAGVLALGLPIDKLAQATSLLLLCVFLAVNISLIVIRRRDSGADGEVRISPRYMPWFGAIASAALLVSQIVVTIAYM